MTETIPTPAEQAAREQAIVNADESAAAAAEAGSQPAPASPAQDAAADPSAPVEEQPKPKSRRQRQMEAIVARREEQVAQEISAPATLEPQAEPVTEPQPVPPKPAAPPHVAAQPGPSTVPPAPQKIRVKTEAGEVELTPEQVADAWLARQRAARIVAGAAAAEPPKPATPSTPAQPAEPAPAASQLDDGEILRRIQFGDADEAAQAIKDLKAGIAQQIKSELGASALSPEIMEQRVVARTMEHMQRQTELNQFGTEFQDVFKDPDLVYVAAQRQHEMKAQALLNIGFTADELSTPGLNLNLLYGKMAAQGFVEPEIRVYRNAAEAVRGKFLTGAPRVPASAGNGAHPQQPGTPAISLDARRELKRSLPQPPAPASAAAPISDAATPRKTPGQIVQAMQSSRRKSAVA